jgi:hypothetical protein
VRRETGVGGEVAVGGRLGGGAAVVGGLAGLVLIGALGLAGLAVTLGGGARAAGWGGLAMDAGAESGISARARRDIPRLYLRLYMLAARRYGLDWAVLAGIGRVECDHGRDPDPSCTREGAVNSAGAGGPAQFLASTWSVYGVSADGDATPDRWNPADAILGMANYLRASGAPADYERAIYAYNHARWYVAEVERWAALYRGPPQSIGAGGAGVSAASSASIAGERAALSGQDGHLALVPQDVPAVVQAMVIAGNELQELPYGAAGHPDPLGATSEDCSSTVSYVLERAGVRPLSEIVRDNPLAQDYVDWGAPGPGRWVTIYATRVPTAHVFIVIAGLRLDTSHDGTDAGPNRDQEGPRWRILNRIPTWARWSVRHPPGL